jgi:aspartyl-tRNA(Asn)/glutamyl-tRNA(Gln) amidotransferase subunit B
MEEGSLRCDANISVMLNGASEFGNKVEVKNMNSIRNVQKAIEFEISRQIECVEAGETINSETRSFNALDGSTISMRSKEAANDYRFFPEPDLTPISVTTDDLTRLKAEMPALPRDLFLKYTNELALSEYDAYNITDNKSIAEYYEDLISKTSNYKAAANWIMGDIKSYLNKNGLEIEEFPLSAEKISSLIEIIDEGKISSSAASQQVFPAMLQDNSSTPLEIATKLNLIQDSDEGSILGYIEEVIKQHPDEVSRYRSGEQQLIGFLMGQLMRTSKGKADPKAANKILRDTLNK